MKNHKQKLLTWTKLVQFHDHMEYFLFIAADQKKFAKRESIFGQKVNLRPCNWLQLPPLKSIMTQTVWRQPPNFSTCSLFSFSENKTLQELQIFQFFVLIFSQNFAKITTVLHKIASITVSGCTDLGPIQTHRNTAQATLTAGFEIILTVHFQYCHKTLNFND